MAQYRQSGFDRVSGRNGSPDQVSIGIRAPNQPHKQTRIPHHRRFRGRKISIGALVLILAFAFVVSVSVFLYLTRDKELNVYAAQDDDTRNDTDFLTNVTRTERLKVLEFGHGSIAHGRDSRYWDRDDRRRDEDYSEDAVERATGGTRDGSTGNVRAPVKGNNNDKRSSVVESGKGSDHKGIGLYNEAGRDELKLYEAEYEASLKGVGRLRNKAAVTNHLSNEAAVDIEEVDADDEYDDGIDLHDSRAEDYDDGGHGHGDHSDVTTSHGVDGTGSSDAENAGIMGQKNGENIEETSSEISDEDSSLSSLNLEKIKDNSRHVSVVGAQSSRRSASERRSASKKKPKRRKFSGSCEMKFLNASQLVEPLESRKFSRFALQYKEVEENPNGDESWEPKFAGHQSLIEREESYIAHDQKINCGFVKGPKGSPSTGFDLAEDDSKYISSCHIAVTSCIFGNSDRLRIPMGRTVSRTSKKNVCFVMFVDEITLHTLSSEGHMPDRMGFIGLWKIVMVKNLPYTDMRRVGKIPKFLPHRLFPSARYSIWLDSKLRLQLDPLLILEYFLWRKGHEYAISNHYDRHCLWEEVAQNKRLNKYNHTIIDEQFSFYQADGLKRFNASDPNKLLPSNVPEGSFIVRAHTPMSNLFSCLWFNEVERFTPRDQLSFAYTYQKLRRTNPTKPFYLNMFKDCERRKIAKLFRHRSEEKRSIAGHATE